MATRARVQAVARKAEILEEEPPSLLKSCALLQHLRITELMMIHTAGPDSEDNRQHLSRLRELRNGLRGTNGGAELKELSNGDVRVF